MEIFANAQFFVLPSFYEGCGTTILESFATGTPAIVTNAGSAPEIAGDCAKIVNPYDTKEISKAMVELAGSSELRQQYAELGLDRAKQFNWRKMASETLSVYEKVNDK